MRTTTLQSSKASSSLWKLFAAMLLVWILVPIGQASAQGTSSTNNGSRSTLTGVDDLPGINPSQTYCTEKHTEETDPNKIVYLYNVGAKKFLSVGGMWGTHASLDVTPYPIYMFWNVNSKTYCLESKVHGSVEHPYLGIDTRHNQVFMDQKANERCIVNFVQAKDYSENNKVYLVRIGNTTTLGYLTAYPNDMSKLCDYEKNLAAEGSQEYKNQEWKVITKAEYYQLFGIAPANMKAAVDASFLIACPDFRANDADAKQWKIIGKNQPIDVNSHVYFGDEKMYKSYDKVEATGSKAWTGYNENHQRDYGQYFYCYTKGLRGFEFYQDIEVHKAGWYLLRCNGFSTANSSDAGNGKPLASLFITELDAEGKPIDAKYSTSTLNGISQDDAYQLANEHEKAGIGYAFIEGKYENQVQICIEDKDGNKVSKDNPVKLRIGFFVDPTREGATEADANELTAVDNFKLLYAGPRRNPELVLDEESTDLRYLTMATDEYQNSVLHLKRHLNANMWNSLILPVDLTRGQMKRTFGDAVKVARLAALTENSVQFVTVEPKNDDAVMVTAFEPYIVYPPYTETKSAAYTVEHFYTSEGEDNSSWLGKDYQSSSDENNRLTKTIDANHYDITMVSLDRKKLKEMVDFDTWESKTTFPGSGPQGTMVCKGTLAKTYDNGKIIKGRDDLNGDFFMYQGKLIQVPSGDKDGERYQYGLKAFRCWFELSSNTTHGNSLSLMIDGVEDSTTSIDDIHGSSNSTSYKRGIEGVFNMHGQMVRRDNSLEGLPKGMYVVNGKKVIIR